MKYALVAIASMVVGAGIALLVSASAQKKAYKNGFRAGLRRGKALRVDLSPGFDSIRAGCKKEFPQEAYSWDADKKLGILSPSRVFSIKAGDYGQDVLDQYLEAEVKSISDRVR